MFEVIRESFVLSVIVCSLCISLSITMLSLIWFFIRKNKNQYYIKGKEVKGFK